MVRRLALLAIGCDLGSPLRPIVLFVAADVGLAFLLWSVLLLGSLVVEVLISEGKNQSHVFQINTSIFKILTSASLSQSSSHASGTPPLFMLQSVVVKRMNYVVDSASSGFSSIDPVLVM